MSVKTDGTLQAATRKAIAVPDDQWVDSRGIPARFIGTSKHLRGWDTRCGILFVTDVRGRQPNDAIDAGDISIRFQVLGDGDSYEAEVDYYDGYFLDIEGPVPAGIPTSEHTGGANFADQHSGDTQPHLRTLPQHQPEVELQPGQPALAALASAGLHGAPVSDEEKARRAEEAEEVRRHAAYLSRQGAGGATEPTSIMSAGGPQNTEPETAEPQDV